VPNSNSLWVHLGGGWGYGTFDKALTGPCGTAFTYGANNSSESIWIVESYGRGIVPPGVEVSAGSTLTYGIQSDEFIANANSLWVHVGGGWGVGTFDTAFTGPCGTAFTYDVAISKPAPTTQETVSTVQTSNVKKPPPPPHSAQEAVILTGGGALGCGIVLSIPLFLRRRIRLRVN